MVLALQAWQRTQAIGWLGALLVSLVWLGPQTTAHAHAAVALGAVVSYTALFGLLRAGRLADWCTLARVALLAGATWWADALGPWPLFALCVLAIVADLLDGAIARRRGPTAHGAVLDMEADQLATLQLAMLAARDVGLFALALPAYRYGFVLLAWWRELPAHDPKPKAGDNRRARLICALCMALQLLALMPAVPLGVRQAGLVAAILALAYSYGDDVVYLLRRREAVP